MDRRAFVKSGIILAAQPQLARSNMAYNTGNPTGSTDPRDLYDNAQNLDNLVNGESPDYQDRLGKTRKSWAGMEQDFADFLAASEYEFLGDYEAGIEVTSYNQVIRDGGEFWRAAADTELPYTTTGAGMPEGGAFVSVGDAVLRQDLADQSGAGFGTDLVGHDGGTARDAINQRTIYVGSVAELEELGASAGALVQTLGEQAPGDGGEKLYLIVAGGPGSADGFLYVDLENGSQAKFIAGKAINDVTVSVPSQFDSLQSAFEFLSSKVSVPSGFRKNINMESGYEIETGAFYEQPDGAEDDENVALFAMNGEYSDIFITSDDAEVFVESGFEGSVIRNYRCGGVVLDCLINMNDEPLSNDGYTIEAGGHGRITEGAGVKNAGRDNIRARQTVQLHAFNGVIATGGGLHGLNASHGAAAYVRNGDFSGCKGEAGIRTRGSVNLDAQGVNVSGGAQYGVYSSDGGMLNLEDADAQNCDAAGIFVQSCLLEASNSTANGSAIGYSMNQATSYNLNSVSAQNCSTVGVEARRGATGSCRLSDASGSGYGFMALEGSVMAAIGATANNCITNAFEADGGSTIDAQETQADSAGTYSYRANSASTISARDIVSASAGTSVFSVSRGSTIYKDTGNGSSDVNVDNLNAIYPQGIIFGS